MTLRRELITAEGLFGTKCEDMLTTSSERRLLFAVCLSVTARGKGEMEGE
jgi:hypothetical protein